jgi:hypothetical protein
VRANGSEQFHAPTLRAKPTSANSKIAFLLFGNP